MIDRLIAGVGLYWLDLFYAMIDLICVKGERNGKQDARQHGVSCLVLLTISSSCSHRLTGHRGLSNLVVVVIRFSLILSFTAHAFIAWRGYVEPIPIRAGR